METGAFKAFRDTGRMQLPEFGTQVGKLKSLWLALMGMTGLGQGEARPLRHSQSELRVLHMTVIPQRGLGFDSVTRHLNRAFQRCNLLQCTVRPRLPSYMCECNFVALFV